MSAGSKTNKTNNSSNGPTLENFKPDNARRRRYNGWQCPWDGMQTFSWFAIIFLAILSIIFALPMPYFPTIPLITVVFYTWNVAWILILTTKDPSPLSTRNIVPIIFDRRRFQHVIENNFCNVCQIVAVQKTKHCRYCNKCIPGYDHHCKWLNTCIGRNNYRFFIVLLISLTIFSLAMFSIFLATVVFCVFQMLYGGKKGRMGLTTISYLQQQQQKLNSNQSGTNSFECTSSSRNRSNIAKSNETD